MLANMKYRKINFYTINQIHNLKAQKVNKVMKASLIQMKVMMISQAIIKHQDMIVCSLYKK